MAFPSPRTAFNLNGGPSSIFGASQAQPPSSAFGTGSIGFGTRTATPGFGTGSTTTVLPYTGSGGSIFGNQGPPGETSPFGKNSIFQVPTTTTPGFGFNSTSSSGSSSIFRIPSFPGFQTKPDPTRGSGVVSYRPTPADNLDKTSRPLGPASIFQAPTTRPAFGVNSTSSSGSSSIFGVQSAPGFQTRPRPTQGSGIATYRATPTDDGLFWSISAMPAFRDKSHEELRWEDYELLCNKGVRSSNSSSGGSGIFGVQSFPGSQTKPDHTQGSGLAEEDENALYQSISAMPAYKDKSHEELRIEDYELACNKGGQSLTPDGSRTCDTLPNTFRFPNQSSPVAFPIEPLKPNPLSFPNSQDLVAPNNNTISRACSLFPSEQASTPANLNQPTNGFQFPATPANLNQPTNSFQFPVTPANLNQPTNSFQLPATPANLNQSTNSFQFPATPANLNRPTNSFQFPATPTNLNQPTKSFQFPATPANLNQPTNSFQFPATSTSSTSPSPNPFSLGNTTPTVSPCTQPSTSVSPLGTPAFFPNTSLPESTVTKNTSQPLQASSGLTMAPEVGYQNINGQQYVPSITVDVQPSLTASPFSTRSEIDLSNTVQRLGISSLPVPNKLSSNVRKPLLRIRHVSVRHNWFPAQRYSNGSASSEPKVPFFDDEVDRPGPTPPFLPRENPRSWVRSPLLSVHSSADGKCCEDKDLTSSPFQVNIELTGDTYIQEEEDLSNRVLALMPKLPDGDGYYTEPTLKEMAAKEVAEPGSCSRVNDFLVGRTGYGRIRFLGETDVRHLDIGSAIQINNREVIVYADDRKKPPVGQGLNKAAEVTLLNVKCISRNKEKQYIDGPRVQSYKEMLINKCLEQGAEFVSYDPVGGEWKFSVQHF